MVIKNSEIVKKSSEKERKSSKKNGKWSKDLLNSESNLTGVVTLAREHDMLIYMKKISSRKVIREQASGIPNFSGYGT